MTAQYLSVLSTRISDVTILLAKMLLTSSLGYDRKVTLCCYKKKECVLKPSLQLVMQIQCRSDTHGKKQEKNLQPRAVIDFFHGPGAQTKTQKGVQVGKD